MERPEASGPDAAYGWIYSAVLLGALAACAALDNWTIGEHMSSLRFLLPDAALWRFGPPPWRTFELAGLSGLSAVFYSRLKRHLGTRPSSAAGAPGPKLP